MPRPHHLNGSTDGDERAGPERVVDGETITGRVRLDGGRFRNCRFQRATLLYAGVGGAELSGCTFTDTRLEFDGPAANTLALHKAMATPGSGLSQMVRASFPQIFGH